MRRALLTLAGILLVSGGCSTLPSAAGEPLARHRARWESARLTDYRFDFQRQCFCTADAVQPVTVEVREGRVHRVVAAETGEEVAAPHLRWYTIADLFEVVEEARANGTAPLVVRYDRRLGYPAFIEVGTLANDAGSILTASNLRRID